MAVNDIVPQRYIRNPQVPRDPEGQILYFTTELDKISASISNIEVSTSRTVQVKEFIGVVANPPLSKFDFVIPAGYDRIILEGYARSSNASDYQGMTLYYNNDTAPTNYFRQGVYGVNATVLNPEANDAAIIVVPALNATVGRHGSFTIVIEGPDSSIIKMAESDFAFLYEFPGTDPAAYVGRGVQSHKTLTAPLTHVSLQHVGGGTGVVRCYGLKQVTT